MSSDNQQHKSDLSSDIDIVVVNATQQIESVDGKSFSRRLIPTALWMLLLVPAIAVCLQALRWLLGYSAHELLPLWAWGILTCAVPAIWIFFKIKTRHSSVSRAQAIRVTDQQLGSSERILTADQFLKEDSRNGFMQAAVDDASQWARRGRDAQLKQLAAETNTNRLAFLAIPLAIAGLLLAGFLAPFSRIHPSAANGDDGNTQVAQATAVTPISTTPKPNINQQKEATKPPPEHAREPSSKKATNRQGAANAAIPDNAEESQGKLSEGQTRESQQSANPSSARGAPSASGQPSKSDDQTKRKPKTKKPNKPKKDKQRESKPRQQEEKPSGSTAGQGSSKGSDNSAAPSDWASMSQAATPDQEDNADEEDEVDDEEEEQESRGGVQPNMRDRRAPVNRDLQIGFGGAKPSPDANGRGGPSGQKKSRGVASLVLGVPIPDRVNGQPNQGRIRITQQRITPEAEQSNRVDAQDRSARQGPVGPIAHPDYSPWLQDIVRRYFLQRRAKHPLNTTPKNPMPTQSSNTTTDGESETPKS